MPVLNAQIIPQAWAIVLPLVLGDSPQSRHDVTPVRIVKAEIRAATSNTVSLDVAFRRIADRWDRSAIALSFVDHKMQLPACADLVRLGSAIVPLAIQRLMSSGLHWACLLVMITGTDPVDESHSGNLDAIRLAWRDWLATNR